MMGVSTPPAPCHRSLRAVMAIVSSTWQAALPAVAWDGGPIGTITALDVIGGSNHGPRISLAGVATMRTGGPAKNPPIRVYSNRAGDCCHIGYIAVQSS